MTNLKITDNRYEDPEPKPRRRSPVASFIAARLDEEETEARAVRDTGNVYGLPCPRCNRPFSAYQINTDIRAAFVLHYAATVGAPDESCPLPLDTWLAYLNDAPAKALEATLRRINAYRWILDQEDLTAQFPDHDGGYADGIDDALHALAVIWDDHPDYDQAWRLT